MGLFDIFKKKKQPKESISMEDYIKIRKDDGVSNDDIKEEIMDSFTTEIFVGSSDKENPYMDTLPTPKGNFTEKGEGELWDKEIYYYGKKIYEERFGEIVNSPLTNVIKNLSKLYINEYYEYDDDEYDDEDYNYEVLEILQRVGGTHKFWELSFFGGEEVGEGYEKYFRREVCKSKDIITDEELVEFYQNNSETHILTCRETRFDEVREIKNIINKKLCIPFREKHFNKETKTWSDFDINGIFLQIRSLMIVSKNPFPHYVWKMIKGNPFDRVYRICRDYMKWKGNKKTTQIVFDNVCKWENGEIFREGETQKEYEKGLWVKWNKVGKDFLTMKTKLKKEDEGGLEWLKDEVGGYIKDKKSFYNSFGEESEYFISDDLIEKYEGIK